MHATSSPISRGNCPGLTTNSALGGHSAYILENYRLLLNTTKCRADKVYVIHSGSQVRAKFISGILQQQTLRSDNNATGLLGAARQAGELYM